MKIRPANFWPKDINAINESQIISYLQKYFPARTQALIALYFSRFTQFHWLKLNSTADAEELEKYLDYCEFMIDNPDPNRVDLEFAQIRGEKAYPFAYIATRRAASGWGRNETITFFTMYALDFNIELLRSSEKDNHTVREYNLLRLSLQEQQNELLGLFLPIKEWKLQYHTSDTKSIAQSIYTEKQWNDCPVLADALMDAGCEDEYILWLLRTQWDKFGKGVWLIDTLAGLTTLQSPIL